MPYSSRPAPAILAAPCSPSERRDRSGAGFSAGLNAFAFERDARALHPAANHRPAPVPVQPMGLVIEMAATGLWVVKRGGALAEIDGRMFWDCREDLTAAAARSGVPLSDVPVSTHSLL